MPAGNPLGYLLPSQQGDAMQQMLASPQAMMGGPHAGNMAAVLLQALGGQQQPSSPSQTAVPTEQLIRPQSTPRLTENDINQIMRMDYQTLMATRGQLKNMGYLTPEVDVHFSKRLQGLNTQPRGK